MNHKIVKNLNESINSFNNISNILEKKLIGSDKRQILLISYFDICMEHMLSIQFLIKNKLYGSAFALVSPFYETYYRALWMLKCATNKEIELIINNKFNFPKMGNKIKELDIFYTNTNFFEELKNKSWNTMCNYTHSGTLQLSRRWKEDTLIPNYEEDEIIEVLKATQSILLMFAFVVLIELNYVDDANKIRLLIINDNKYEEANEKP